MFKDKYNKIANQFKENFKSIECAKSCKIIWPKGFGVYAIWQKDILDEPNLKLIYIGLTGSYYRIDQNNIELNHGSFKHRARRWTPYFFDEKNKPFSFKFGPKYSNVNLQGKHKLENDAYKFSLPYDKIQIDFFQFDEDLEKNHEYTPASLEAILLSSYLFENKTLPPANNKL